MSNLMGIKFSLQFDNEQSGVKRSGSGSMLSVQNVSAALLSPEQGFSLPLAAEGGGVGGSM